MLLRLNNEINEEHELKIKIINFLIEQIHLVQHKKY